MIMLYPLTRRGRARDRAEALDRIVAAVGSWPGVATAPHQFDAIEFQIDGIEFGHLHRSGVLDVPFVHRIRNAIIDAGLANSHRWVQKSGWVSFEVKSGGDVDNALRLLRLSYLYRTILAPHDPAEGLAARRALDDLNLPPRLADVYEDLLAEASTA